jgi:hypothetical protein
MYRQDFAAAVKEIKNAGGEVRKIFNNLVFYVQNDVEYVFVPEMTDGGPVFIKKTVEKAA